MKKSIYYAHGLNLYNSPQEQRDIDMLVGLGFDVLNPSDSKYSEEFAQWREEHPDEADYMNYFKNLVGSCDAIAFRSLIDGSLTAGVAAEVQYAMENGMPMIELPNITSNRFLNVADTRLLLKYLGQR